MWRIYMCSFKPLGESYYIPLDITKEGDLYMYDWKWRRKSGTQHSTLNKTRVPHVHGCGKCTQKLRLVFWYSPFQYFLFYIVFSRRKFRGIVHCPASTQATWHKHAYATTERSRKEWETKQNKAKLTRVNAPVLNRKEETVFSPPQTYIITL